MSSNKERTYLEDGMPRRKGMKVDGQKGKLLEGACTLAEGKFAGASLEGANTDDKSHEDITLVKAILELSRQKSVRDEEARKQRQRALMLAEQAEKQQQAKYTEADNLMISKRKQRRLELLAEIPRLEQKLKAAREEFRALEGVD